jgi:hypothetical protein
LLINIYPVNLSFISERAHADCEKIQLNIIDKEFKRLLSKIRNVLT